MTLSITNEIEHAHADALLRWQQPFPGFTSGQDPRTTDNALLVLMYGGLVNAAEHDWLNAGRRLIDKTYIDMLWHVQQLTAFRAVTAEHISAALDSFIRGEIAPHWHEFPRLTESENHNLADVLVQKAAASLFGSLYSEVAASRLLFFLCPMLYICNFSRGSVLALKSLGYEIEADDYVSFSRASMSALEANARPLSDLPLPIASYGTAQEQALVQSMLTNSDWWQRRVFDALLLRRAMEMADFRDDLFACTDAGKLT